MKSPVFLLSGFQTDFARNLSRDGREIGDLVRDVVEGTLDHARVEPASIESIHVGNAFGGLFNGQTHLGAMPATVVPALWGVPASRHEGACASGSLAILAAAAEIEAERYDCVLVVGVEQQRNVPGDVAAKHLGAAAWVGHEGGDCRYLWPKMFSDVGDEYARRYGLDRKHLAHLAKSAFDSARRNPNAQTRGWSFGAEAFLDDDVANPVIEGRIRRQDCGQITDGGAGVVVCSARFAEAHARRISKSTDDLARILGWGHRTAGLSLDQKLRRSEHEPYVLPDVRRAIVDAYRRASLAGPEALDGIETHDCFTVTEYVAIDHFGITAPGECWKAIEDGSLDFGGRLPMNPSGGLIGLGHPVGATGVRMALDAQKQVTGTAGDYQVEGAKTFATLNIGGSCTTIVSLVIGSNPPDTRGASA